jgi:hypothetical protein
MKKSYLTLVVILMITTLNAQNKKEQISALTYQIDSLNAVVLKERTSNDSLVRVLNADINVKKEEIQSLNTTLAENQRLVSVKDSEILLLQEKMKWAMDSVGVLTQMLKNYQDTLQSLSESNYEGNSYLNGVQSQNLFSKKYEKVPYYDGVKLLKFQKYPMSNDKIDIVDWLNNFTKTNESRLVYNYDSDPIDWIGPEVLVTELYENGIVVEKYLSYESIVVKIRLPFISKEDALRLFAEFDFSNLALGCSTPIVEVVQEFSGVTVIFGSGC